MSLLEKIKSDQLQARKNREQLKSVLLTTVIGEASAIGKNDGNRETTDQEVTAVIQKFLKGINETHAYLIKANDPDLEAALTTVKNEKEILEGYLPTQLTVEQLTGIIGAQLHTGTLVKGPTLKGTAMKYLKETFAGQYDGKVAAQAIDDVMKA